MGDILQVSAIMLVFILIAVLLFAAYIMYEVYLGVQNFREDIKENGVLNAVSGDAGSRDTSILDKLSGGG